MTEPYDTAASGPISEASTALEPGDPAYAGQAVYTARTLRLYDAVVVRLSNSLVWRCPAAVLLGQYRRHLTPRHLDVGPGTGFYLDHCRLPGIDPELTLMDANPAVLRYAGARLRRYRPTRHQADVLQPNGLAPGSFDSIGLSYVLHCLPGDLPAKAVAFDHLIPLLEPGGVVFGSTILSRGVRHTRLGRTLLRAYNSKGIFANERDDLEGLRRELARRFDKYDLEISGAVALFAGWI